jgi:N-acetylglutamate synthase-like GNAT family acetyltransferase
MNRDTEITSTSSEDLNAVLILLADAARPQEGVHGHFQRFLVARGDGRVIGSVGIDVGTFTPLAWSAIWSFRCHAA